MSLDEENASCEYQSFWEPQGYKATTKRVSDGLDLCHDLIAMIKDRCDLEEKYAQSLKSYSKKWSSVIAKGPEYNTMERATLGVCREAESLANVHLGVRDRLAEDVVAKLKKWSTDTYHKNMFGRIKEKDDFSDQFKKAQKPWIKKLDEVERCKKKYHSLSQKENQAETRKKNFLSSYEQENGGSMTAEQMQQIAKLDEEITRLKDAKSKAKCEYESAILTLHKYNVTYIEAMRSVSDDCQEFERKRLIFFKQMLAKIHDCVDFSNSPTFQQIYVDMLSCVNLADEKDDLKWWSVNRGTDMNMNWPTFEDYSSDYSKPILKKPLRNATTSQETCSSQGTYRANRSATPNSSGRTSPGLSSKDNDSESGAASAKPPSRLEQLGSHSSYDSANNPFADSDDNNGDEDETDSVRSPNKDDVQPGTKVIALYDYNGVESDELSFKKDQVFEKLGSPDDQGWCKGRLNGKIGLIPGEYIKEI